MNIYEHLPEDLEKFRDLPEIKIAPLPNCPAILTREEAAHICNVSKQTIDRMITAELLPVNCDGDIRRADLIAYIQTHTLADKPLL